MNLNGARVYYSRTVGQERLQVEARWGHGPLRKSLASLQSPLGFFLAPTLLLGSNTRYGVVKKSGTLKAQKGALNELRSRFDYPLALFMI